MLPSALVFVLIDQMPFRYLVLLFFGAAFVVVMGVQDG